MSTAGDGRPRVTLVVAADAADGIGKDGDLPWRLPEDLKFFKRVTMGHPLVMGRKTHDSIGRSLPGRLNVVVTRQAGYQPHAGAVVAASLEDALAKAADADPEEVMVIGGAEIFRLALPLADRIYLTRVHATFDADTFLPGLMDDEWKEVWREQHTANELNPYDFTFLLLERV